MEDGESKSKPWRFFKIQWIINYDIIIFAFSLIENAKKSVKTFSESVLLNSLADCIYAISGQEQRTFPMIL